MYKTEGKEERKDTLVMEICECDDWELGDFPLCDFSFPHQVGCKKYMLRVRELCWRVRSLRRVEKVLNSCCGE